MAEVMSNRPAVFVVCCARSGSTLVRYIVDTHPDIVCPPESHLGPLCERLRVTSGVLQPEEPEMAAEEARHIIEGLLESHAHSRGKRFWCEKSVSTVDHLDDITWAFPDARFICLHRHCLDVVASALSLVRGGNREERYGFEKFIGRTPHNLVDALIDYWVEKTETSLAFEERKSPQCLRVRYEDIVRQPTSILPAVFSFIGVDWDPRLLDAVFATPHEEGPGDATILYTGRIDPGRVGKGASISVRAISDDRLDRMNGLLRQLDYEPVGPEWDQSVPLRPTKTPGNDAFSLLRERISNRLEMRPSTLHDPGRTLRVELIDGNEFWVADLGPASTLTEDDAPSTFTVRATSAVLTAIAAGELRLERALWRGQLTGELDQRGFEQLTFLLQPTAVPDS